MARQREDIEGIIEWKDRGKRHGERKRDTKREERGEKSVREE
jgi:hypothetical protein